MPTLINPAFRGEAHETKLVPDGVVELRVHGVNGGTPEANLHDPHPLRVSGDDTAGFYRRRDHLVTGPDRTVEAYNWSSVNSRASSRAWWVLLLPFAFANFAGWLLPKGMSGWRRGLAQIVARLVALVVTVIGVLGIALVAIDLIAVQCAESAGCVDRFWLGWLGSVATWEPVGGEATRRAVLLAAVPALAVLLIWLIGRRSNRYDDYGAPAVHSPDPHGDPIDHIRMDRVEFWQASDVVYVQAWLHASAAVNALAATLAFSLRQLGGRGSAHHEALAGLGIAAIVAVAATAVAVVGVHWMHQVPRRWLRKQNKAFWIPRWSWIPAGVSIALLVWVAVLGWDVPTALFDPPLEAFRHGIVWAVGIALALVLVLGVLTRAAAVFLWAVAIGGGAIAVVWRDGPGGAYQFGGSAQQWLLAAAVIAVLGWLVYHARWQGEIGDSSTNPAWIFVLTGVVTVPALAAFHRGLGPWGAGVAVAVPVVLLAALMGHQIRRGRDQPASEEMRVGVAAVMAGLAVASMVTLVSGATIFVGQRLGSAVPEPSLQSGPDAAGVITPSGMVIDDTLLTIVGTICTDVVAPPAAQPDSARRGDDVVITPSAYVAVGEGGGQACSTAGLKITGTVTTIDNERSPLPGSEIVVRSALATIASVECPLCAAEAKDGDPLALIDGVIRIDHVGADVRADGTLALALAPIRIEGDVASVLGREVVYPAQIGWFALTAVAGIVVLVATVLLRLPLLMFFRWRRKTPDLSAEYDADAVPAGAYDVDDGRRKKAFAGRATSGRWLANVTDDVDWMVTAAVVTTLLLMFALLLGNARGLRPDYAEESVIGFASWFIAFIWIGLFWVIRSARDNRVFRGTVGIMWDVSAFFPRRFHPLAPPCYAERSVIDVRNRIIHIREQVDGGKVLLVAHSEGTLIVAAALLSLLSDAEELDDGPPVVDPCVRHAPGHPTAAGDELDGVALVTYGCMLRRLFSRAWPDQLPLARLADLKEALGDDGPAPPAPHNEFPAAGPDRIARWMNFGRYTDYLGGRMFAPLQAQPTASNPSPELAAERPDDVFFRDPTRRWRYEGQPEHARMWRHSFDYESDTEDPRFRDHVWSTAAVLADPLLEPAVASVPLGARWDAVAAPPPP